MLKPPPLQAGDTIAIVAPASCPADPGRIFRGVELLKNRGFNVELARSTFEPHGYLCGNDRTRLEEFNHFLRRPDIRALFCVRGGYGSLRLLPDLDYEAMLRYPRLIVGYSDVTALHLAFLSQIGLPGLAGPMVAVEWPEPDPETERQFWSIARGESPLTILGPRGEELIPVRSGSKDGIIVGGNLTLITRLIGTPYLPDLDGAILFLEEVGEEPYRIDGLFSQLKYSGILDRLGGLILGGFTEWKPEDGRPTLSLDEVLQHYTQNLSCPVAKGLVFGHFPAKSSIPVGVRASLEVNEREAHLVILEPVVANVQT